MALYDYNPASYDFSSLLTNNNSIGGGALGSGLNFGQDNSGFSGLNALQQQQNPAAGFGFNIPTAQLALSGLSSIGNLWGAFQTANLAKDQFNFSKNLAQTNLTNQTKSYNTSLADRINARASVTGMSQDDVNSYLKANSL